MNACTCLYCGTEESKKQREGGREGGKGEKKMVSKNFVTLTKQECACVFLYSVMAAAIHARIVDYCTAEPLSLSLSPPLFLTLSTTNPRVGNWQGP